MNLIAQKNAINVDLWGALVYLLIVLIKIFQIVVLNVFAIIFLIFHKKFFFMDYF